MIASTPESIVARYRDQPGGPPARGQNLAYDEALLEVEAKAAELETQATTPGNEPICGDEPPEIPDDALAIGRNTGDEQPAEPGPVGEQAHERQPGEDSPEPRHMNGFEADGGTEDKLTELATNALEPQPQPKSKGEAAGKKRKPKVKKIDAANLDPMPVARKFADRDLSYEANGEKTFVLRRWQEQYYSWGRDSRRYVRVSDEMVKSQLRLHLEPFAKGVTNTVVANIMGNLSAVLIVGDSVQMPSWLDGDNPELKASDMLATKTQLIHLPSLIDGTAKILPATPRFFSGTSLDFDYDPNAAPPVAWLEFLRQVWGNDRESIECLQEWFGYLLSGDTSLQKILTLIGPRRSGKGTIGRVLRGLIGKDNIGAPTMAGLGTNFGLWPIYDRSVAVISDARISGRTDSAIVTERLLSISGEDPQTFDRKNMKPLTMILPTRFVILTNELPRLGDSSNALVGRFIVLRMTESFYGREDPTLTEKLLAELPGILLWAIEGWKRLRDRGRFVQPESGKSLIGDMEAMASPVGEFVRDRCIIDPAAEVPRDEMYTEWRRWCAKHGKHETDQATFGRDLRATVASLGDKQRNTLGVRVRCYTGIGLQIDHEVIDQI